MTSQDIFTTELAGKKRGGARLIDVRERDEYVAGHIPGAAHLPLSKLPGREDESVPNTVLICASGNRCSQAAAYLVSQGQDSLMNLSGGTVAWVHAGRDLIRSEQP